MPREPLGIAAIPIQGRWRYRTTTITRPLPGGDGTFDVWAVATDNSIVGTPLPHTDTTDYNFDLRLTATGVNPSGTGVTVFEKVGEVVVVGGIISTIRQTFAAIHGARIESAAFPEGIRQIDGSLQIVPPGVMFDYGGDAPPAGYLLCQGQQVSQTTYAALFGVLGTKYNTGGETGGNFRLPDRQGRVSVGKGTHVDVNTIGKADAIALASRRPVHSHSDGTLAAVAHTHTAGTLGVASHTHDAGTLVAAAHLHAAGTLSAASHSHGPGTLAVASHSHGDGTLGVASHTHGVGTYVVASHTHGLGTLAVDSHTHSNGSLVTDSHSHADGSLVVASHTHSVVTTSGGNFGGETVTDDSGGPGFVTVASFDHTHSNTSGSSSPTVNGSTAGATATISGSTSAAAPGMSGATASATPALSGASAATAPDVAGSTASAAPLVDAGLTASSGALAVAGNTANSATVDVSGDTGPSSATATGATGSAGADVTGATGDSSAAYLVSNVIIKT